MELKTTMLAATITLATSLSALAAEKDIVDTAVEAGQFKTFAAALEARRYRFDPQGGWSVHRLRSH